MVTIITIAMTTERAHCWHDECDNDHGDDSPHGDADVVASTKTGTLVVGILILLCFCQAKDATVVAAAMVMVVMLSLESEISESRCNVSRQGPDAGFVL